MFVPLAAAFDAGLAAATFLILWLVTLVTVVWLGARVLLSRCPRCQRRFFAIFYRQFLGGGLFQRNCAHCGLGVQPS